MRKNTFLPNSSSFEMSTPGGGVVSSAAAPGLAAAVAVAADASPAVAAVGVFAHAASGRAAQQDEPTSAPVRAITDSG